jgi:hypothetical protein
MYGSLNMRMPRRRSGKIIIPFCDGTQSTKYDSTTKLILGSKYYDPTSGWGIFGYSTVCLVVLLGTTSNSNAANADLYQQTGTGSPATIASGLTTTSLTAAKLSADVSAYFRPGGSAGIFNVRTWITTFNGNDQATCYGAWLEITTP